MASHSKTAADAAVELNDALTLVAEALVKVDVDALLAAETGLGRALTSLGNVTEAGDRAAALAALRRARAALLRCRRLGASFSTVSRALLGVGDSAPDGYTRAGGYAERVGVRPAVLGRV